MLKKWNIKKKALHPEDFSVVENSKDTALTVMKSVMPSKMAFQKKTLHQ